MENYNTGGDHHKGKIFALTAAISSMCFELNKWVMKGNQVTNEKFAVTVQGYNNKIVLQTHSVSNSYFRQFKICKELNPHSKTKKSQIQFLYSISNALQTRAQRKSVPLAVKFRQQGATFHPNIEYNKCIHSVTYFWSFKNYSQKHVCCEWLSSKTQFKWDVSSSSMTILTKRQLNMRLK